MKSILHFTFAALAAAAASAALPAGYTELEYFSISGNGAANNSSTPLEYWLDTGVVTKHDWTFEVAFAYDQLADSSYQSCLLWDGEIGFWNYTPSRSNHALVAVQSFYYELSYVLQAGKKHVFKLSDGVLHVDGVFENVFSSPMDLERTPFPLTETSSSLMATPIRLQARLSKRTALRHTFSRSTLAIRSSIQRPWIFTG